MAIVGDRLWEDFSFVAASGYRERVLHALSEKPKFPKDIGRETSLRITHVSRALREMSGRGLVACLNAQAKARGRIYGATETGARLIEYFDRSSQRFVPARARGQPYVGFVPKIRGSSILRFLQVLRDAKGAPAVDDAIRNWAIDARDLQEESWISVDACAELLELAESKFGDGSYGFIRSLFAEAGRHIEARSIVALPLLACVAVATVLLGLKGVEAADAAWIWAKERRVSALVADLEGRIGRGDVVQMLDTTEAGVHALLRLHAVQPTRFLYDFHFYHDVETPIVQKLRADFIAGVDAHPPAFVVLFERGWPAGGYERIERFEELRRRLSTYRVVARRDGYVVYAR